MNLKRFFDLVISILISPLVVFAALIIGLLVMFTSEGDVLYWSSRVGKGNKIFSMPKFRTMKTNAPQIATHLLINPDGYLTPVGSFLRKTSLDELPQVWSILIGDMSFVGPRPALFNQQDLIELRTTRGIHTLLPGLTGWAQVNGRDDLPLSIKVKFDEEYLIKKSFAFDLKIIYLTFIKVIKADGVKH